MLSDKSCYIGGDIPLSRIDAKLFFQLVYARYGNGSPIITCNKCYIEWGDFLTDEGITSAIPDRLLHFSKTIMIEIKSHRRAMKKKMGLFIKNKQVFFLPREVPIARSGSIPLFGEIHSPFDNLPILIAFP